MFVGAAENEFSCLGLIFAVRKKRAPKESSHELKAGWDLSLHGPEHAPLSGDLAGRLWGRYALSRREQ